MALDEKFQDAVRTRSEKMHKGKKTARQLAADSAHDRGVSPDLAAAITARYQKIEAEKDPTKEGDAT